ncbi:hypothetical protein AA14337_3243 [Acetobacter malorum DSM 14337]|uniref:Uncharacterized protein n=1 Tax=Acetobacter malorum DSM 14337 TaxID=1307910 RepID=A0ABQ0Q0I0_9PROT|nr:hypothetical protein [Acetobacter malorum]GBQ86110.1 hypothetical protein AA14337_3243 [Acetobacter malorum DSM 14337]
MQDLFAWAESNPKAQAPLPELSSAPPPSKPITPPSNRILAAKASAPIQAQTQEKQRLDVFRRLPPPPPGWVEEDFSLTAPPGMNMLPDMPEPEIGPDLDLPPLSPELVIEEAPAPGM